MWGMPGRVWWHAWPASRCRCPLRRGDRYLHYLCAISSAGEARNATRVFHRVSFDNFRAWGARLLRCEEGRADDSKEPSRHMSRPVGCRTAKSEWLAVMRAGRPVASHSREMRFSLMRILFLAPTLLVGACYYGPVGSLPDVHVDAPKGYWAWC